MNTEVKSLAKRSDLHILRKLWHIFFGSSCVGIYYLMDQKLVFWGYFALGCALAGFTMDLLRMKIVSLNNLVLKVMGPLMRKSEVHGFSGLPFYALGIGLSILFFQKDIALLSILFLVFADPIASFVGINFGKDKILPNKSLQGSVAAFFVCYLVSIIYIQNFETSDFNIMGFAILAGLVGALSELASAFNIDDNLTIPVLSGAGLSLINYFFHIF